LGKADEEGEDVEVFDGGSGGGRGKREGGRGMRLRTVARVGEGIGKGGAGTGDVVAVQGEVCEMVVDDGPGEKRDWMTRVHRLL
jgi:hypothetical protein